MKASNNRTLPHGHGSQWLIIDANMAALAIGDKEEQPDVVAPGPDDGRRYYGTYLDEQRQRNREAGAGAGAGGGETKDSSGNGSSSSQQTEAQKAPTSQAELDKRIILAVQAESSFKHLSEDAIRDILATAPHNINRSTKYACDETACEVGRAVAKKRKAGKSARGRPAGTHGAKCPRGVFSAVHKFAKTFERGFSERSLLDVGGRGGSGGSGGSSSGGGGGAKRFKPGGGMAGGTAGSTTASTVGMNVVVTEVGTVEGTVATDCKSPSYCECATCEDQTGVAATAAVAAIAAATKGKGGASAAGNAP
jgi:hypothetical protein